MSKIDYEQRKKLDAELKALSEAVDDAIRARRAWMDAHMEDYARYKIGETVYRYDNGQALGVVEEYYRYPEDSMRVEYRFTNGDNTSRYGGIMLANAEELRGKYAAMSQPGYFERLEKLKADTDAYMQLALSGTFEHLYGKKEARD